MLLNRTIAVPENRQLDILARLLENRDGNVLRVPLVAIHDSPHVNKVSEWLHGFIGQTPDLFVIFTGEGLRRLLSRADTIGVRNEFIDALSRTKKLCRGPKPVRVLRELKIACDIQADTPTTEGVISSLEKIELEEKRIAVQLYGEEPNQPLMDYLDYRKAKVETVAPYVYADESETASVVDLIHAMVNHEVDVIAFTSQPQFRRLLQVAKKNGLEDELRSSLAKIRVAAVGPVVKQYLEEAGIEVHIMPEHAFFMKPLVTAIVKDLANSPMAE